MAVRQNDPHGIIRQYFAGVSDVELRLKVLFDDHGDIESVVEYIRSLARVKKTTPRGDSISKCSADELVDALREQHGDAIDEVEGGDPDPDPKTPFPWIADQISSAVEDDLRWLLRDAQEHEVPDGTDPTDLDTVWDLGKDCRTATMIREIGFHSEDERELARRYAERRWSTLVDEWAESDDDDLPANFGVRTGDETSFERDADGEDDAPSDDPVAENPEVARAADQLRHTLARWCDDLKSRQSRAGQHSDGRQALIEQVESDYDTVLDIAETYRPNTGESDGN